MPSPQVLSVDAGALSRIRRLPLVISRSRQGQVRHKLISLARCDYDMPSY